MCLKLVIMINMICLCHAAVKFAWHGARQHGSVILTKEEFIIGLSIERPILDHHPKAHIHEIREIRRISP